MRNRQLWILATILTAIGTGVFLYKLIWLDLPLEPEAQVTNWEVQAEINFDARGGPTKLVIFIPRNERPFTIMNQSFISEGYGLTTTSAGDNRQANFSTREATGEQRIYYRFIVNRSTFAEPAAREPEPPAQKSDLEGARLAAARGVLNTVVKESTDGETMVRLLFTALNDASPSNNVAALLGSSPTLLTRVRVARDILVLGGVRTRMVTGIQLSNADRNAPLVHWIEAYVAGEWRGFTLNTESFNIPSNYLPWWRGTGPLAYVEGGMALETTLSISSASEAALRTALIVGRAKDRGLLDYSLFTLPLDTQLVYKIILTVPIGVFLLTILRNMVGIRTFGTFMPILIAIAFRETQVVWGVILFTTVVAIGLLARLYLDNLRLLIVPRLASVLIIVVLVMAAISVFSNQLGVQHGLSVALFPMVILTMTVERMSIIWDERGPGEMLQQGISSLIVAIIAYFIMVNPYSEHLVLVFPELLLILLAGNLLIGRYSGFRLCDLPRFRMLAGRNL